MGKGGRGSCGQYVKIHEQFYEKKRVVSLMTQNEKKFGCNKYKCMHAVKLTSLKTFMLVNHKN